jgi:hypothetical protein
MSKSFQTWLLAATVLACAPWSTAHADASYIRLDDLSTWAWIGQVNSSNMLIAWDSAGCHPYVISYGSKMTMPLTVVGGPAGDGIGVVMAPMTWCGYNLTPPNQDGYAISIYGGAGQNSLDAGISRQNIVYIDPSSDPEWAYGNRTASVVWGPSSGNGRKTIYGGNHAADILFGSPGPDQFCELKTITASYMMGGPGYDKYCGWATHVDSLNELSCTACGAGYN